jgi:serine/threonine-protein kinase
VGSDLIGRTIGNYRLVEAIGSGGMGDVYKAVNDAIGARVAIKVLNATGAADEASAARFLREARAVNRIDHEDVVKVVDAGRLAPEGRPYLVMELLEGESLADALKRTRRPPLGTACKIIDRVLAVAEAAHARGIVHRDLKPQNIFLTHSGRTIVLDFGVAKLLDASSDAKLTLTGSVVGTPHYMAPEQIRGVEVDHRSDLYAIGCVLYELVAGRRPFDSDVAGDVLEAHLARRPAPPRAVWPDIPEKLQAVVLTALAKAPEARFQSAAAMRAALASATAELPPEAFAPLPGAARRPSMPPEGARSSPPRVVAPPTGDAVVTVPARAAPHTHDHATLPSQPAAPATGDEVATLPQRPPALAIPAQPLPAAVFAPPPRPAAAAVPRRRTGRIAVIGAGVAIAAAIVIVAVVAGRGAGPGSEPRDATPSVVAVLPDAEVAGAPDVVAGTPDASESFDPTGVAQLAQFKEEIDAINRVMREKMLVSSDLPDGRRLTTQLYAALEDGDLAAAISVAQRILPLANAIEVDKPMVTAKLAGSKVRVAGLTGEARARALALLARAEGQLHRGQFMGANDSINQVLFIEPVCVDFIEDGENATCVAQYCGRHPRAQIACPARKDVKDPFGPK